MDWTHCTSDPCDSITQRKMHEHLKNIRQIEKSEYMDWLLNTVEGQTCLDIGAVEHDISYTEKSTWKHRLLVDKASKVVGVDILEDCALELNKRGFDIRVCDATSDQYLGEKFDLIVLGDVIEHVENPVALVKFALRHLNPGGEALVKTPNPYYIDNIKNFARNRGFVNFEHMAWYTPTMALEIARRASCNLKHYMVFPKKRPWPVLFPGSDLFTRDFLFIFCHSSG